MRDSTPDLNASDEVRTALGKVVQLLVAEERANRKLDNDPDEVPEQIDDILKIVTDRLLRHALVLHEIALGGARTGSTNLIKAIASSQGPVAKVRERKPRRIRKQGLPTPAYVPDPDDLRELCGLVACLRAWIRAAGNQYDNGREHVLFPRLVTGQPIWKAESPLWQAIQRVLDRHGFGRP
ncbi:hypothetical protein LJ655_03405 [Paraburkholderia sp. MMS20-SJTN17]|uniref:Uncharacterized protein n=1 Tax=Paraburkholderia translucens TaxID=2886945 RepID=A0ABS8K914_9BURK|nr:hypothetical protein [Paraburkholderia sp. MMS20-SJTN17]MCC8400947.1 hypothetical protein [Paraburkholderia sp. MMS20-SJTN17]